MFGINFGGAPKASSRQENLEQAPASPESFSLKEKLLAIIAFLTVSSSAMANEPSQLTYASFADLESKSKSEYEELHKKMSALGIDTLQYDRGDKHFMLIDKNGALVYQESAGGTVVRIEDTNGDMIADRIDLEGYLDASQKFVHHTDDETVFAKQKGLSVSGAKRIKASHTFAVNSQAFGNVDVNSTIPMTTNEEQTAFMKTQGKFVQGIKDAQAELDARTQQASN